MKPGTQPSTPAAAKAKKQNAMAVIFLLCIIGVCVLRLLPYLHSTRGTIVRPDQAGTTVYPDNASFVPEAIGPPIYGGDYFGSRFYDLKQINKANVTRLKVAWMTAEGEKPVKPGPMQIGPGFESSPIFVDGRMIEISPTEKLDALDPQTGHKLWVFTPTGYTGVVQINRGAASWIGQAIKASPIVN